MADTEKDLRNIIVFAMADGDFNDDERAFVDTLRRQAGMTTEDYDALLAEAQAGESKLSLPRDADDARRIVDLLIQVAAADGMVSQRHRALLKRIARHIEFDEAAIDQMIDESLAVDAADDVETEKELEDIYAHFNDWDAATRQAKLDALAAGGIQAALPLLRMLESYRVPDGAPNALDLKEMIVRKLGELCDGRAVYYLIQQISIGNQDDEITNVALRYASAEALGKITGLDFAGDQSGVDAARTWWSTSRQRDQYDRLAL